VDPGRERGGVGEEKRRKLWKLKEDRHPHFRDVAAPLTIKGQAYRDK